MDWPTFYVHKSSAGFILHNKLLNPHKFWCLTDCLGVSNLTLSKHCTSRISPSYDIQRSVFRHLGNNWPYSFWNSRVFSLWKRHFRNFLPILSSQALVSLFFTQKATKTTKYTLAILGPPSSGSVTTVRTVLNEMDYFASWISILCFHGGESKSYILCHITFSINVNKKNFVRFHNNTKYQFRLTRPFPPATLDCN